MTDIRKQDCVHDKRIAASQEGHGMARLSFHIVFHQV